MNKRQRKKRWKKDLARLMKTPPVNFFAFRTSTPWDSTIMDVILPDLVTVFNSLKDLYGVPMGRS